MQGIPKKRVISETSMLEVSEARYYAARKSYNIVLKIESEINWANHTYLSEIPLKPYLNEIRQGCRGIRNSTSYVS